MIGDDEQWNITLVPRVDDHDRYGDEDSGMFAISHLQLHS